MDTRELAAALRGKRGRIQREIKKEAKTRGRGRGLQRKGREREINNIKN